MRKGFVTLTNGNDKYVKLVDVLVESVLDFTDYEIEVYGVNFDYNHSNKRVIPKKINLENENFESICFSKIQSCISSDFDLTVHLDSDIVISGEIKKIFEEFDINTSKYKFPKHPWDGQLKHEHISCMNYMGTSKKTQPYVHAATFIFSKEAKDFFQEVYNVSQKMLTDGFHPINQDETILNCLLWKNSENNSFIDCYDPYYEFFKSKIGLPSKYNHNSDIYSEIPNFNVNYYLSHGCKNFEEAKEILEKLKELKQNK